MRTDYTLSFGERIISSVKLFEGSDKNFYQKNQAFETGPVPQGVAQRGKDIHEKTCLPSKPKMPQGHKAKNQTELGIVPVDLNHAG